MLVHHLALLTHAVQHLTQRLADEPHNPRLYIERGMAHFKLCDVAAAVGDFDRAEQLNPALTPYLWQRGLAYYYMERFADGAKQFERDLTVNGHDVEETVWRYLCQAQLHGAAAAREALLPVRHDARPVMARVYKLFAGECDAATVLAQHREAGRRERFYSYLYVGLYCEAERDAARTRHYIAQAAAMQVLGDYMGWVAIVHQHLRGGGKS
jgi:lipoprotein NlpI